jgi:hypothetical protein
LKEWPLSVLEFSDAYDEPRYNEWEAFRGRYERHREYLLEAEGEEANSNFVDRLWGAFEAVQSGPLLFEESDDRLGQLTEVVDGCDTDERSWLKQHPEYIGLRCEARLCGVAPEWLAMTLCDDDRKRLSELALDYMVEALPAAVSGGLGKGVRRDRSC